jgi:sugar-specific transcriptional regulator TrmB
MNAAQRYYQKNREQICARMRERDAARREEVRQMASESPELREEVREDMREKYHRGVESKITRQLRVWLDDPLISGTFKKFIRESVWEHKHRLSPAFVRGLGSLNIKDAFSDTVGIPTALSDGASEGSAEEAYGSSEA